MFSEYPYLNKDDLNLDYILKRIREVLTAVNDMEEWKVQHEAEYAELKALYDQIVSGNFPASITNAFNAWMQENTLDLVGNLVKMVFFGLTDSGYFVAYIPESWNDITFKTTEYDYFTDLMPDYGHLVLQY